MSEVLEHPAVSRALRTGFGFARSAPPVCPCCGEDMGDRAYETEPGYFVCEECFTESVRDYLNTNPLEVAEALSVKSRYLL